MTTSRHPTTGLAATTARCPVCRAAAVYVQPPDRFFHVDGSDNQPCWRAILARPLDAPDGLDAESAARIDAAVAATVARREQRRRERAELAARRSAGLAARHAHKQTRKDQP
ncbi:hypothetical protein [Micromonospora sp. DT62]|uniref:hypothetical protein n=1 Tax=Micromonospora sp. DT62 TaxID=3416521 RepID=UPI003CED693C